MNNIKTRRNDDSVRAHIAQVSGPQRRQDAEDLLQIFSRATGFEPAMWGTSIIGYGQYHYKSERSRQEGDWPLTGFAVRKRAFTVYITPGFTQFEGELQRLGKHKTSVGCLYINQLSDIDQQMLENIIRTSVRMTEQTYSAG
jgi:hypothetical protein